MEVKLFGLFVFRRSYGSLNCFGSVVFFTRVQKKIMKFLTCLLKHNNQLLKTVIPLRMHTKKITKLFNMPLIFSIMH